MIVDDYTIISENMRRLRIGGSDPFIKSDAPKVPAPKITQPTGGCEWCVVNGAYCDGSCCGGG
jgi:hypothetical protein